MRYDPRLIQPFRDELTKLGFRELNTPEAVDAAVEEQVGTTLFVVNSVCGCAAGKARPGIAIALKQAAARPDRLLTVFAGGDVEATARLRERFGGLPPSSPSMALFKEGKLVHFLPRYQIEGRTAIEIARHLAAVFEEFCGPAVEAEAR
jgi:putative YphP/YqiW family bacilliredoxin